MEMGRVELGLGTQGRMPRLLERGGGLLGGTNPCIASAADPAPSAARGHPRRPGCRQLAHQGRAKCLLVLFPVSNPHGSTQRRKTTRWRQVQGPPALYDKAERDVGRGPARQ